MHNSAKRKVVSIGPYRFTGRLLGKGNFARVEEAVHGVLNIKVRGTLPTDAFCILQEFAYTFFEQGQKSLVAWLFEKITLEGSDRFLNVEE